MTNQRGVISLEVGWGRMQTGLKKLELILEGKNPGLQFSSDEYMESYTVIYNMCTQKHPHAYSKELYDKYKEVLVAYLTSTVLPSLSDKHGELFLREVVLRWSTHTIMVRWLSRFFHYLDRYFIARRLLPPLKTVGITCFKDLVYDTQLRKGVVSREIIYLIDREREGEKVDHAVLKNAVDIYVGIGLESMDAYEDDFEAALLADTAEYYSRKASRWIVQDSCPEYMVKAEECLKKEKDRVGHYLHSSTESKLLDKAQQELLTKVSSQLLDKEHSGCRALLRDDKVEDLSRMYRLFSRIPDKGLDPVAATFKQHVSEEGAGIVKQAEDAAGNNKEYNLIRKLIDLHDKYLDYVVTCFANSSLFHKSLKEAFEMFCNKTVADNSTAELLASFCDNILRGGGSEKLGEEAVEETLEKVVRLLAFISDKDMFAEFARKKLARRLLNDKGYNEDHERSILSKLKQNYGGQFTSKMEGMVIDITLAKETNNAFALDCGSSGKPLVDGVHLTVSVLTTGFWPTYKSSDINLPAEMVKCVEKFKEHYNTKTKHRKLTWIHSMGSCTVNGKFDAKDIELVVSPYQACLLLLFNSSHKLSFQEIVTQLNLSEDDVLRALHALSCHKYKILTKEPSTKSISTTDVFEFNPKFNDKMRRIKVPNPPVADEKKKVVEDVGKDRRYAIDAALVRIMKSRKVLAYQQLVMECVEQLSRMFKPDVRIIKKRIEDLITRDYLERDAENPNTFKYLA